MSSKVKPEFEEKIKSEFQEKIKPEFEEIKLEPEMDEQPEKPPLLESITLSRTVCLPAKMVKTVYTETNDDCNKLEKLNNVIKVSSDHMSRQ